MWGNSPWVRIPLPPPCRPPIRRPARSRRRRRDGRLALDEARAALDHDDVPVGAVVVHDGTVIAARHNERELTGDPTAHAEVLALRDAAPASATGGSTTARSYVTLEPCAMCAGALVNARLGRLVYGATDPKAGAVGSCSGSSTATG